MKYEMQPTGNGLSQEEQQLRKINSMSERARQIAVDVERVRRKAFAREEAKLAALALREQMRRDAEEEKRCKAEILAVRTDGVIVETVKNTQYAYSDRCVCNLMVPTLTVLINAVSFARIYVLRGMVSGKEKVVYLDGRQIERGAYLLRKMGETGILFIGSRSKAKDYAAKLLSYLLAQEHAEEYVAERPGWLELPDGSFKLVTEGEKRWEEFVQLSR